VKWVFLCTIVAGLLGWGGIITDRMVTTIICIAFATWGSVLTDRLKAERAANRQQQSEIERLTALLPRADVDAPPSSL
jgi:hypothetical protein